MLQSAGQGLEAESHSLSAAQGIVAKLAPKYTGPYVITAKLGSNVYELQDLEGKDFGKVHVQDLKLYQEEADFDVEATRSMDINSACLI